MGLQIKFWGVRDVLPLAPSPHQTMADIQEVFSRFFADGFQGSKDIDPFLKKQGVTAIGGIGGNSSCIEILSEGHRLIVGAGSGIKRLGDHILANELLAPQSKGVYHILLPSCRLDQLMGLPFFTPLFIPGNEFHFYSAHKNIEDTVRFTFSRPYFPVEYSSLPNPMHYHHLPPIIPTSMADFKVTTLLYPPYPSHGGFIIRKTGASFAYFGPLLESDEIIFSLANNHHERALLQNLDLVYIDTNAPNAPCSDVNLTRLERKADLATRLAAKRILFGNYSTDTSKHTLLDLEEQTKRKQIENSNREQSNNIYLKWSFVYEDQIIEL